jgi:transposase-like protein
MDETFVGGKPRKGRDKTNGKPLKRGRGTKKIPVIGMVERGGNVKAQVSKKVNFKRLSQLVRRGVDCKNSLLVTDEFTAYSPMFSIIDHKIVNHSIEYADGEIHTNTIEGFWALLKRGIIGQYHKVSVRYLQQYVNEFAFRFNNRKNENVFALTLLNAVGGAA